MAARTAWSSPIEHSTSSDLVNEGDVRFRFDEGALSARHPGETVEVALQVEGAAPKDAAIEVRGLNCPTVRAPLAAH